MKSCNKRGIGVNPLRQGLFRPNRLSNRCTKAYRLAWKGASAFARSRQVVEGLYHIAWDNPCPGVSLVSLDLTSRGLAPSPFVVAITVE